MTSSNSSHGSLSIDIRFGRANKTYFRGDNVTGVVIVSSKSDVKHDGIRLEMEGMVRLQAPGKTLGIIDAISNSTLKSIPLCAWGADIERAARLPSGTTEIPFEFCLEPSTSNKPLYESYHGVFIAIQYAVKCDLKRSFPQKSLHKASEFLVEKTKADQKETVSDQPIAFTITQDSVRATDNRLFGRPTVLNVTGKLDSSSCSLSRPLTGHITIHRTDVPVKSIELQLLRVETCGAPNDPDNNTELSLVQSLQVADGDVLRGVAIPLHMVFPRLFACSSLQTPNFGVAFELCVAILFENDYIVKELFPLTLHRY